MIFYVLFAASGIFLMVGTVYLARRYKRILKPARGLYFKAGLSLLLIELFHYSVLDSALQSWPDFVSLNIIFQGLILGLFGGLFFELGRFFILDKWCKVKTYNDAVYFGLGWNGAATFLYGVLVLVGTYGIYLLTNTPDISTIFPGGTGADIEQINQFRDQASSIIGSTPFLGLAPIFERGSLLALDLLLTLIIVFGFLRGTTTYVWLAVLIHSLYISALIILNSVNFYLGLSFLALSAVIAGIALIKTKKMFFFS